MQKISTVQELENVVSSVQNAGYAGDIECGGEIIDDVRSFFSTYQRSNEIGWATTGLGILGIGLAIVVTGGAAAVAGAALFATGAAIKGDVDRKATKRMTLGDLCYELAHKGYRMKRNSHASILLSCQ